MRDILVIQAARFGDIIQSARLILSLAQNFHVHLVIDENLADLARIVYPQAEIHGLRIHCAPSQAALVVNERVFAALRKIDFARIYNCNFSGLTGALCRLFENTKIVGYRPAHDSQGGELRSSWARIGFKAGAMRAASPLNLVDFWAWFTDSPIAPEQTYPAARPNGGGIGIALAGREARRSLPAPIMAEMALIASGVLENPKLKLFGTAAESGRARQLIRRLPPNVQDHTLDLCGKTGWQQLVDEITGLDLLLTPDTGIMHLGASLGVPVIAFFLSSAWCHETGPYGLGHRIFQAAPVCAPCLEKAPCQRNLACHELYKTPDFMRTFAMLVKGDQDLACPDGLQIWQSGFDSLGAKLELLAGKDGWASARSAARTIIMQKLKLCSASCVTYNSEYSRMLEHFVPDQEWMLPPGRYC